MSPGNGVPDETDGAGGTGGTKSDAAAAPDAAVVAPWYKRPGVKAGFVYAGIFVIGCAIGSIVTTHVVFRAVHRTFRDPEKAAARMLGHMRRELDLTEEQTARIRVVLEEDLAGIGEALRNGHDRMHERVCEILTPEQREAHRKRVSKMRRWFFGGKPHGDCEAAGEKRPGKD